MARGGKLEDIRIKSSPTRAKRTDTTTRQYECMCTSRYSWHVTKKYIFITIVIIQVELMNVLEPVI